MGGNDPKRHDREPLVDPKDLINAAQVAERLGIAHRESVLNWRRRHVGFPAPIYSHGRVNLWLWSEVRAWAIETGRLDPDADEGRTSD